MIETIADLMLAHGVPGHIRSGNGPEFTAHSDTEMSIGKSGQDRLHQARRPLGERLCGIVHLQAPGRAPDREIFYTLVEARVMLERFRIDYSTVRPHSALGYLSPLEAIEAAA